MSWNQVADIEVIADEMEDQAAVMAEIKRNEDTQADWDRMDTAMVFVN